MRSPQRTRSARRSASAEGNGVEITVEIDEARLKRRLAIATPATMRELNRTIGIKVLERVKDFLARMSWTRHKVANRLGAPKSPFYEHAPGRTVLERIDEHGATIAIRNTPGLSRAYHDLHITPKRARALTIPIHRIAKDSSVRELREKGHVLFRLPKSNVLAERSGTGKRARVRPLYALCESVTVPRDPGLLPSRAALRGWAKEAAEAFFETRGEISG